jgi:DNA-binding NtrC family response regulator
MPLDLQAKLLRVLQDQTFIPVGGERAVRVDVRIVSATHRALREEVKAGRFREDLLYRLRVVPIFLPPLRERRGDIALLLRHFIARHNAPGPRRIEGIAPEAMRALLDHRWPGNVRELGNVVEYAFAVGRGPELLLDELPPEFRTPDSLAPGKPQADNPVPEKTRARYRRTGYGLETDEAVEIRGALQQAGGRIDEAARITGMSRATFWRKRKRYGV